METINNIELTDQNIYPKLAVLSPILGESFEFYSKLLDLFNEYEMTPEWRYYADGKAWLCKVTKKKKTIVWMSAWKGFMQATVYAPQKYLQEVYASDIQEITKERIRATKDVGISKPCIFQIKDEDALKDIEKVMKLKIDWK